MTISIDHIWLVVLTCFNNFLFFNQFGIISQKLWQQVVFNWFSMHQSVYVYDDTIAVTLVDSWHLLARRFQAEDPQLVDLQLRQAKWWVLVGRWWQIGRRISERPLAELCSVNALNIFEYHSAIFHWYLQFSMSWHMYTYVYEQLAVFVKWNGWGGMKVDQYIYI